jgi:phage terminase small subunit
MALSNKQRAFVEHYLICWNASEAARRAGYSRKNADVVGPRLLVNVGISAEIARRLAALQMSADEVLVRLTEHARGSMADFVDPATDQLNLVKAEAAGRLHLIKSFKHTKGQFTDTISIELYDAQNALVNLGKHLKLFGDEVQHSGELLIRYVNDWRNPAADAPSGPTIRDAALAAVQHAEGGTPVAQDDDVHVDLS